MEDGQSADDTVQKLCIDIKDKIRQKETGFCTCFLLSNLTVYLTAVKANVSIDWMEPF